MISHELPDRPNPGVWSAAAAGAPGGSARPTHGDSGEQQDDQEREQGQVDPHRDLAVLAHLVGVVVGCRKVTSVRRFVDLEQVRDERVDRGRPLQQPVRHVPADVLVDRRERTNAMRLPLAVMRGSEVRAVGAGRARFRGLPTPGLRFRVARGQWLLILCASLTTSVDPA